VTFEGDQFSDVVLAWIDRRWNAFSTYTNCLVVLALSFVLGLIFLGYSAGTRWWLVSVGGAFLLCAYMARATWKQVMGMIEFQAQRVTAGRIPKAGESEKPSEDLRVVK
jgi:hypothetical protein